jgi:hypothetical protein
MTKKFLLAAFAAAAVAVPALACDAMDGFSCSNQCPLAQQANTHRSTGREASAVRTAMAAQVERNLARV